MRQTASFSGAATWPATTPSPSGLLSKPKQHSSICTTDLNALLYLWSPYSIYRSIDRGESWFSFDFVSDRMRSPLTTITAFQYDPNDPTRLYSYGSRFSVEGPEYGWDLYVNQLLTLLPVVQK